MRLSLELPTAHLKLLTPLLDVNFCLAQNVLSDEVYADFYREEVKAGRLTIMDNGFHELKRPLGIGELQEAVRRVHPSFVVSPDWLGDGQKTWDTFQRYKHLLEIGGTEVALALQTEDEQLLIETFSAARARECRMLCFPYRLNRHRQMEILLRRFTPNMWPPFIHLFGVSTLQELSGWKWIERQLPNVTFSFDTAKPIKHAFHNTRFTEKMNLRNSPVESASLHELRLESDQLADVYYNIAFLRKYC